MQRGFPRPRSHVFMTTSNPYSSAVDGSYGRKWENRDYPHPYTADTNNISKISGTRLWESISHKRCGTCGEAVEEDLVGMIIYNPNSRHKKIQHVRDNWVHGESGPYHIKCLVLNFTMCPMLSQTKLYLPAVGLWDDVKELIETAYFNS